MNMTFRTLVYILKIHFNRTRASTGPEHAQKMMALWDFAWQDDTIAWEYL